MQEIWKDIKGYESLYQVSNTGKVKSVKRDIILSPSANHKGYLHVGLCNNGIHKTIRIHRLVAEAFIPNPENKEQVNHINGIKTDNNVNNLEWCTNGENQKHAFSLRLQTNVGNNNPRARKINQYDLRGNFIKSWNSIYDIERILNFSRSSIWRCCTNKYKQSHGYVWRYAY